MPIQLKINSTKVPIHVWTDDVESEALNQATNLANYMPVYDHVALMPDVHSGYGMPIGGVLPLVDAIYPFGVGVDIGCGIRAIRTNVKDLDEDTHKKIRSDIHKNIPVGFSKRAVPLGAQLFDKELFPATPFMRSIVNDVRPSLGTLGGGNHFIEIQKGSDGFIWAMIHSGSRNAGKITADHYHKLAVTNGVVPNGIKELAYFAKGQELFGEYTVAMNWCLDFAYRNRCLMMDYVIKAFEDNIHGKPFETLAEFDVHHNYAEVYDHVNVGTVYLHRKGATSAKRGAWGLIPGSMGASSFVVEGLGNADSFDSCSHGAGRKMSRGAAKKNISVEDYTASLEKMGLTVTDRDIHIDEAPGAYKDVHEVMANQNDLVKIRVELKPYQFPAIKG